jgi:mono/diheme cytochrome c family protein
MCVIRWWHGLGRSLTLTVALAVSAVGFNAVADSLDTCTDGGDSCLQAGALLFQQRCTICHGSDGLGEGPLSLISFDYPNSNLLIPRVAINADTIRRAIADGPLYADISALMPPWRDELTPVQIEALTQYVVFLRQDLDAALRLSRRVSTQLEPSVRLGRAIFFGRCSLCHGLDGMGSGRLGARLRPKAANLVESRAPNQYLRTIIAKGGESLGRSNKMPAWDMELIAPEVDSLVLYINALRSAK